MTANPTATDRTTSSVDPSPTVAQQETPAEDETTPSGLEPPTYSTTVKPDRLPELAQAISDLGRDSGYAQARLDYDAGTIEFLWSGPVPVDVQTLADTNDDGIKVTFTSAKYSLQELEAAMKELSALADELEDQVPFWGWGPNEDFSGLLVQIEGSETPSDDVLAQIRNRTGIDNISIELM